MNINTLRDYLWVIQAFLRGKILRQKAYRPKDNSFCLSVPVTGKRISILMKWWKFRPMTIKEAIDLMGQAVKQQNLNTGSPFLSWKDNGWEQTSPDNCGCNPRFLLLS
jgi:hypothetical protein